MIVGSKGGGGVPLSERFAKLGAVCAENTRIKWLGAQTSNSIFFFSYLDDYNFGAWAETNATIDEYKTIVDIQGSGFVSSLVGPISEAGVVTFELTVDGEVYEFAVNCRTKSGINKSTSRVVFGGHGGDGATTTPYMSAFGISQCTEEGGVYIDGSSNNINLLVGFPLQFYNGVQKSVIPPSVLGFSKGFKLRVKNSTVLSPSGYGNRVAVAYEIT